MAFAIGVGEENAFNTAAYLRITSIAIAAYDYLETQPTAWKFYREHWQSRRLTISIILFALLRFTSICVLTVSSVGFFYSHFTNESCKRFYLLPPAFKVIQAMVSQAILAVRTFNLSRRSSTVGWTLIFIYIAACVLQWVTTVYQRTSRLGDSPKANCRPYNQGQHLGAYIFYAIAIVYDTITTSMSIWYLLKYKFKSSNSVMLKLSKMMLYDGLGYLILLTGVNVLNLILYKHSQDIQTAGASLGYCVSWIMSQRLLIHLYDASRERREEEDYDDAAITISKNISGHRTISRVVRTNFDKGSTTPFDLSHRVNGSTDSGNVEFPQDGVDVQVRIERTVKLNHYARTYELEDYSRRTQNR